MSSLRRTSRCFCLSTTGTVSCCKLLSVLASRWLDFINPGLEEQLQYNLLALLLELVHLFGGGR